METTKIIFPLLFGKRDSLRACRHITHEGGLDKLLPFRRPLDARLGLCVRLVVSSRIPHGDHHVGQLSLTQHPTTEKKYSVQV